jgi:hypothetical protein
LKLLIAKANAGHVIWFMATVNRIAEILRLQGDLDSADVRRSKAIGILAQPALALQLLWEFRGEQHPAAEPQQPDEPIHNEHSAPYDQSTAPPGGDLLEIAADARPDPVEPEPAMSPDCGLTVQPPGMDPRKLRPQVVSHIHLSEEALLSYHDRKARFGGGVGRFEGVGLMTLGQVRRFLADTDCDVKVQPVIDLGDTPPVDGYEIPRRIREAMFLRMPASCFPYAAAAGRLELDHTVAYKPPVRGGPPGQTGVHSLGPLIRFEHGVKTHSRWQVRQPESGVWLWRSPHGAYYLVTNAGTHTLGDGPFARRLWRAAAPTRRPAVTPA